MVNLNKLQISVTTGRLTLPVTLAVCLFLWIVTINKGQEFISLLTFTLTTYLLVELNNAFALIRTCTTFHISLYVFLVTVCFFLHSLQPAIAVPIAFLLSLSLLFKGYEEEESSGYTFHAFFFLGLGSLLFPQLLYFAPLFYIGMTVFRSLSLRSFFAGIIGLSTPYWFLFGFAFYQNRMGLFWQPLLEAIHFKPIDYSALSMEQCVWGIVIVLISLASTVCYFLSSYLDKVRTRLFLSFMAHVEAWICLLCLLQPQHFNVLLQMQIILGSIFTGHLFVLTRNLFSGIFFTVTFVILIVLAMYSLWMQFSIF